MQNAKKYASPTQRRTELMLPTILLMHVELMQIFQDLRKFQFKWTQIFYMFYMSWLPEIIMKTTTKL